MTLEGYAETKPSCDGTLLVNPDDEKCIHGSIWTS